jgi:hypothetical protein
MLGIAMFVLCAVVFGGIAVLLWSGRHIVG